jgi:transketolase
LSPTRHSLITDEVRHAVETVAPGCLDEGQAPDWALDLVASNVLRALAMDMVQEANSGHPGGACSSMDFAYVLHQRHLRYSRDANWTDRDRFILSGGHMSTQLYGLLYLQGHLSMEDLQSFRQLGARTQGHPVVGFAPGIETTTGPLGQGFANGVGMALAERLERENFGPELVDHRVWVLTGDGDIQEGLCREAAQLAGHWGLGRLNVFHDSNGIQLASPTASCWTEDVAASFRAMGWHVVEVENGHDHAALDLAIQECKAELERPSLLIGKTRIAMGTEKEGQVCTHGSPLGEPTINKYKADHGHPEEKFWMPPAIQASFQNALDAGDAAQSAWEQMRNDILETSEELRDRWQLFFGESRQEALLARARKAIRAMSFEGSAATRVTSGKALAALADAVPCLVGGSADLANSTKTDLFEKAVGYLGDPQGEEATTPRALRYGVREHAMASISNGIGLHGGWLPFAGTFLVFSDYLRGSIRLASISRIPVTYVFTHDSFMVGEDGETHQPVEHTESLRLIPGLQVIRPADAYEAAEAWLYAMERHLGENPGPIAMILSRQGLPTFPGGFQRAEGLRQGGYLLHGDPATLPDVELIASGSEVSLALDAAKLLEAVGHQVRVVSVPCRELFEALPQDQRDRVLHPGCPLKVVLEAGRVSGWGQVAGGAVESIGMTGYGASAPGSALAEKFGFTSDQVAARVTELLSRRQETLKKDLEHRLAYLRAKVPAALEGLKF